MGLPHPRLASTAASGSCFFGQVPVELGAGCMALLRAGLAGMTAIAGRARAGSHRARGFGVTVPDLFTKIGVARHLIASLELSLRSKSCCPSWSADRRADEPLGHQRVPDPLAPPVADDEARVAQHLQVMANRRLTLAEGLDEVAHADLAPLRGGEDRDDPEPRGVGQGGEPFASSSCTRIVERVGEDRRAARIGRRCRSVHFASPRPLSSPIDTVNASTIINASMVMDTSGG